MPRTIGSTSNVFVTLRQLNERFGEDALIPIARRFANENHLKGRAMHATKENIEAMGNQPCIEEKIDISEVEAPTIPSLIPTDTDAVDIKEPAAAPEPSPEPTPEVNPQS